MLKVLFFCIIAFLSAAEGAEVLKVKGKKALLGLTGDQASPGDQFYTLGADGKRRGLVRIGKVKDEKAIAEIVKGRVEAGMLLQAKSKSTGSEPVMADNTPSTKRMFWGAMLGYSSTSMKVKVTDFFDSTVKNDVSLSGSGYSAKGLFDYQFMPHLWFRGLGGLESFNASGSTKCGTGNASVCDAKINYLTADLSGRYVFVENQIRPWAGLGVSLMYPVSKSATAIQTSSISTTSVILIQAGVDIFVKKDLYIPLTIEYGMFPSSDEVKASWIALRAGFALPM